MFFVFLKQSSFAWFTTAVKESGIFFIPFLSSESMTHHKRTKVLNVVEPYHNLNDSLLVPAAKGELEFDDVISDAAQYGRIQVSIVCSFISLYLLTNMILLSIVLGYTIC